MSCKVQMSPTLEIEDDDNGFCSWEEGEDIHLILKDGTTIFGEIRRIKETMLTIETEDEEKVDVNFDTIDGYYL